MCIPGDNVTTNNAPGADSTSQVLTTVTASLSIIGSLAIIASFWLWRDLRTISRQILVYISIADFLTSGGNLVGASAASPHYRIMGRDICAEQSLVTTTSCLSFIMWTTILSVHLYLSIARGDAETNIVSQCTMVVFGWVIPIVVTLSAYLLNALGGDNSNASGGWCWLRDHPDFPRNVSCRDSRLMWSLLTGKGWEIPSYIVVPFFYFLAKYHIGKEVSNHCLLLQSS